MTKNHLSSLIAIAMLMISLNSVAAQKSFNNGWRFLLPSTESLEALEAEAFAPSFDHSTWQEVSLPHNAHNEPLLVNDQWQGICWYRKSFDVEGYSADKKYLIEFEAAMNHTTIWINGSSVECYEDGYLPIVVDATPYLKAEGNTIAVRLYNNDNERTGPKPLKILDFNMYGGLYRNVNLITKSKQHITHPILANRTASGGVFITTPQVDESLSRVRIQTHVANECDKSSSLRVGYKILDAAEQVVAQGSSSAEAIAPYGNHEFVSSVEIESPNLWSPDSPSLYHAVVELYDGEELLDKEVVRFGIRSLEFHDNQLYINGKKSYLRGVNRHQEYPYIGYALSDNAQYRDAKKIKEAGFDYVRLSHYPHSPAFMDACDELGLLVADAILGWQFYREDYAFKNHSYESARRLIRRDRNHPCVLAWETSLNETKMPISFMEELHKIVHEEYPGERTYSCGWMSEVYDIYFQARQHRIGHPDQMTFEKPYMVSEYGDWEYYSTNAGLNQHKHSQEKRLELSSRQLRSQGEKALIQQAFNLQESHNDNMSIPATGDSYWVMFDYNRGYHKDIESSGVMDIFRLPKFGYHLYASQRTPTSEEDVVLEIATYWDKNSLLSVKVFSNCDKVKLSLNGRTIATQSADRDANTTNLQHPPFTFEIDKFKAGRLVAEGYIAGKKVAQSEVRTPLKPVALKCWIDQSGRQPQAGCNDVIFLYVAAVDRNGTICHDYTLPIEITCDSMVEILNTDGVVTEAGIATALLGVGSQGGGATISAKSSDGLSGSLTFEIVN
ncbi:MAG: glycoside hydrolase family 2 TIM barrel-domain containing protein [Rikenellaceae bacterium]